MSVLLETNNLSKHFDGLVANQDINFSLEAGSIRCVIGPNGSGKTTFISMISGHLRPTEGRIIYKDRDVTDLSVIRRARIGIARKFQTPTVFENLTAYQNIELAVLGTGCPRAKRHRRIFEILDLIRLSEVWDRPAQFLSHGQRQWLEVGLLIAIEAELLLLDEPTAGMTAEETASTARLVQMLARELKLSVIIIEHDINFIRDLRAPVTVLHLGRVLLDGSFEEVAANDRVRDVYLGHEAG
ncbi:MAG: ATP-binding cassette domain-containing protein [Alphaproteobacteria bacterium]